MTPNNSNNDINYSWDLSLDHQQQQGDSMSLLEQMESLKQDVVTTISNNETATTVANVIDTEKAKIKAAYTCMCAAGNQSAAYKFVLKCLENLKAFMYKILGHIQHVWAQVVRFFSNLTNKQLEMSL